MRVFVMMVAVWGLATTEAAAVDYSKLSMLDLDAMEICDDGIDNDLDGFIDGKDDECQAPIEPETLSAVEEESMADPVNSTYRFPIRLPYGSGGSEDNNIWPGHTGTYGFIGTESGGAAYFAVIESGVVAFTDSEEAAFRLARGGDGPVISVMHFGSGIGEAGLNIRAGEGLTGLHFAAYDMNRNQSWTARPGEYGVVRD